MIPDTFKERLASMERYLELKKKEYDLKREFEKEDRFTTSIHPDSDEVMDEIVYLENVISFCKIFDKTDFHIGKYLTIIISITRNRSLELSIKIENEKELLKGKERYDYLLNRYFAENIMDSFVYPIFSKKMFPEYFSFLKNKIDNFGYNHSGDDTKRFIWSESDIWDQENQMANDAFVFLKKLDSDKQLGEKVDRFLEGWAKELPEDEKGEKE